MRYSEIVNELFDSKVEWEQVKATHNHKQYEFHIKDYLYVVDIARAKGNDWGVAFEQMGNDDYAITGTGNAQQVFSTVIDVIKSFIDQYSPSRIQFSAERSEPSRVKLYRRMVRTLGIGSGLATEEKITDTLVIFDLIKNHQPLNELFDTTRRFKWREEYYQYLTDVKVGKSKLDICFNKTSPIDDDYQLAFGVDQSTEITGAGNQFEIFSIVIHAIKDFMKKHPIDKLEFSSVVDEPSRVKLYDRMTKKLASEFGFSVSTTGDDYEITYQLIKESSQINELFDDKIDWRWISKTFYKWISDFEIDDRDFKVKIEDDGEFWNVEFFIETDDDEIYDITGTGNAYQIFATVKDILLDFINNKKPDSFQFSAAEISRMKLYDRISRQLESSVPYQLTIKNTWSGRFYQFNKI